MASGIESRKKDHLDLCSDDAVSFRRRSTLLDQVRLVHQSLPDLHLDEIDLSVQMFGKQLKAPLLIAAMTGGTEKAAAINRDLAKIAENYGYAFGLGSQRAMHTQPEQTWTYEVRKWAPSTLIFGNVGVVQARDMSVSELNTMVRLVGADALCAHMNPAMELIQGGGDRDFRGGTDTFKRLARELSVPVIAKETGCGISKETADKLSRAGVLHVDVSGAGGTSWVGVETLRAQGENKKLGEVLWDWGIPTAVSVHWASSMGLSTIATGGIRHGLDVAAALAMGAHMAGIARPVLQAYQQGGIDAVEQFLEQVQMQLRATMLLCGARTIAELQSAPKVILGELRDWIGHKTE
ncbi:MAG: type 2 isopentenyl-diphosphate Delta-isomerase [Myxococcales bacterium]|nr:MAG: type 2 isopentenyl-diphosphate Delta-isomerase [Myxococcales bacterium]